MKSKHVISHPGDEQDNANEHNSLACHVHTYVRMVYKNDANIAEIVRDFTNTHIWCSRDAFACSSLCLYLLLPGENFDASRNMLCSVFYVVLINSNNDESRWLCWFYNLTNPTLASRAMNFLTNTISANKERIVLDLLHSQCILVQWQSDRERIVGWSTYNKKYGSCVWRSRKLQIVDRSSIHQSLCDASSAR